MDGQTSVREYTILDKVAGKPQLLKMAPTFAHAEVGGLPDLPESRLYRGPGEMRIVRGPADHRIYLERV